jgi:Tol biopolymer transport system component
VSRYALGRCVPSSWAPAQEFLCDADGPEIVAIDPDARTVRNVTNLVDDTQPVWSPDGRRIAFMRLLSGGLSGRVAVAKTDGTDIREVGSGWLQGWAPDGQSVLIVDAEPGPNGRIVVASVTTGSRRIVGRGAVAAWSPDGRRIAVVRHRMARSDFKGSRYIRSSALLIVTASSNQARVLVDGDTFFGANVNLHESYGRPVWSPDGKRLILQIAFHTSDLGTSGGTPRVVELDGQTRLLTACCGTPVWSPDGAAVVVGGKRLSIVRLDGSVTSTLPATTGWALFPSSWSSDGRQISCLASQRGRRGQRRATIVEVKDTDSSVVSDRKLPSSVSSFTTLWPR